MTTVMASYDSSAVTQRTSQLRQMLTGAMVFDAAGGIFCLVVASDLARWLSIPRGAAYVTGGLFLAAAAVGAITVRREPLRLRPIVTANEAFALWCLLVLATDRPSTIGVVLLAIAAVSSAGTGLAEFMLGRRR